MKEFRDIIADRLKSEQDYYNACMQYLDDNEAQYLKLFWLLCESNLENDAAYLNIILRDNQIEIEVSGTKENLNTIFGILRKVGLSPSSRPKENESSYYAYFRADDYENEFRVWLSFTSTVCKRVPVGTRMVEETIYEVRCE